MKSNLLVTLCVSSLLAFTAPLAMADEPHSKPGQMIKVLNDLKAKGYVIVKKIEFNTENGAFEAVVVNAEGKNLDIQINAKSGQMTKPKGAIEGLTAIEIAKKLQAAGYANISEINTEILGNQYAVTVLDDKGEKVKLKVDVKSGEITKD